MVVASIIAAAPLAGALAAGAAGPGLRAVAAPCLFLWLGILHREIVMDIQVWEQLALLMPAASRLLRPA